MDATEQCVHVLGVCGSAMTTPASVYCDIRSFTTATISVLGTALGKLSVGCVLSAIPGLASECFDSGFCTSAYRLGYLELIEHCVGCGFIGLQRCSASA